jgi:hypothetical protein
VHLGIVQTEHSTRILVGIIRVYCKKSGSLCWPVAKNDDEANVDIPMLVTYADINSSNHIMATLPLDAPLFLNSSLSFVPILYSFSADPFRLPLVGVS